MTVLLFHCGKNLSQNNNELPIRISHLTGISSASTNIFRIILRYALSLFSDQIDCPWQIRLVRHKIDSASQYLRISFPATYQTDQVWAIFLTKIIRKTLISGFFSLALHTSWKTINTFPLFSLLAFEGVLKYY